MTGDMCGGLAAQVCVCVQHKSNIYGNEAVDGAIRRTFSDAGALSLLGLFIQSQPFNDKQLICLDYPKVKEK